MHSQFTFDFVPMPDIAFNVLPKNTGFKVKRYLYTDEVPCIREEFERLYHSGYTHVINMPGNLNQIICAAKHYNIVCVDYRLLKYVSEFCSRQRLG